MNDDDRDDGPNPLGVALWIALVLFAFEVAAAFGAMTMIDGMRFTGGL
jgi:hypothetical protein